MAFFQQFLENLKLVLVDGLRRDYLNDIIGKRPVLPLTLFLYYIASTIKQTTKIYSIVFNQTT